MEINKRFYLAYGSNLSVEEMAHRAPDAKVIGTSILQGWQLIFRQFATIVKNPGYETPVLVWNISSQDEKNLDWYEDFPRLYFKKELDVEVTPLAGGRAQELTAMVYIMTEDCSWRTALPGNRYYNILNAGYEAFGFDKSILSRALEDSIAR